jgi:MFS family permease
MKTGSRTDLRWLLALVATSTCTQAVRPTASYRALELGGSAAAVGAVAASYAILSVFLAVPLGMWIDRHGARRFMVAGAAVLGASAVLSALSTSIATLAVAQGLVGLGQVSFILSMQSIIANRAGKDEGFARLTLAGGTGQLVGPLLAGWLVGLGLVAFGLSGTTVAFLTGGGLAFVGLFLAVTGTRQMELKGSESVTRPTETLRAIAGSSGLGQALITSIVMTTSIEMMVTYLPVLGTSRGIAPAVIGAVLGVRAVSGLASRVVMTRMLIRFGRSGLLAGALVLAGLAMLGIALSTNIWLLYLLAIIVGFGLGIGAPMTMAIVARKAPEGSRAAAMGVRITGDRTGLLVLALILGGLASVLGAGTVFVAVSSTLLASAEWLRRSPHAVGNEPAS